MNECRVLLVYRMRYVQVVYNVDSTLEMFNGLKSKQKIYFFSFFFVAKETKEKHIRFTSKVQFDTRLAHSNESIANNNKKKRRKKSSRT